MFLTIGWKDKNHRALHILRAMCLLFMSYLELFKEYGHQFNRYGCLLELNIWNNIEIEKNETNLISNIRSRQGLIHIYPSLEIASLKLSPKTNNIILKTLLTFQPRGSKISLNIILFNLINSHFTKIRSRLIDYLFTIFVESFQKTIDSELSITCLPILLIEDDLQDPLGLYLALLVDPPDLGGCQLEQALFILENRNDYYFFESIVEMFLIVMKRRIFIFFNFLLPYSSLLAFYSCDFFPRSLMRLSGLRWRSNRTCHNEVRQQMVDIFNIFEGIYPENASLFLKINLVRIFIVKFRVVVMAIKQAEFLQILVTAVHLMHYLFLKLLYQFERKWRFRLIIMQYQQYSFQGKSFLFALVQPEFRSPLFPSLETQLIVKPFLEKYNLSSFL